MLTCDCRYSRIAFHSFLCGFILAILPRRFRSPSVSKYNSLAVLCSTKVERLLLPDSESAHPVSGLTTYFGNQLFSCFAAIAQNYAESLKPLLAEAEVATIRAASDPGRL